MPLSPARPVFPAHSLKPDDSSSMGSSDDEDLSPSDLYLLNYDAQQQLSLRASPHDLTAKGYTGVAQSIRWTAGIKSRENVKIHSTAQDDHWDRPPFSAMQEQQQRHIHAYRQPRYAPQRNLAHSTNTYPRPLIDHIKNEWRHIASDTSSPTDPDFQNPFCVQICLAPKFQRTFLVIIAFACLIWGNWKAWAGTRWNESVALDWSLKGKQDVDGVGWFGSNMRPQFFDMLHIDTLDTKFLPLKSNDSRLIIVGDVHGCQDELNSLLAIVQYERRNDHLIFTGDLIGKGPSSDSVVDLAIESGASCVRGIHEDRILLANKEATDNADFGPYTGMRNASDNVRGRTAQPSQISPGILRSRQGDIEAATIAQAVSDDRTLVRQLTERHIDYLSSCPVILSLDRTPSLGTVYVAHAGLVAGVPAEKQDPVGVMSMRTVDLHTHVPSADTKGVAWWKLWNRWQARLEENCRSTVIYGHDSDTGLNLREWTKGIDSGCWKGGKLSAFVISGHNGSESSSAVSVDCKDYRSREVAPYIV